MVLATLVACLVSASEPGVIWVNAVDVDSPIVVEDSGAYTVWALAPRRGIDRDGMVRIGEVTLSLDRVRDTDAEYVWYNLGAHEVEAGAHAVSLGEGLAIVVLAKDAEYEPERVNRASRVLPTPEPVVDGRALRARHTDTVFTFPEYTLETWEEMAAELRVAILTSSGLFPLPEKTPLNAEVFDRTQFEDYSIEKVRYEAWPGYYVTGNLYRPVGEGPFPAVYSPHGHWEEGRLVNSDANSVPARGITLARMGAVMFAVDMVGYNDSMQFEHRWTSNENKLWGIHPFALQLWAGIRGIDFLQELPDVDDERIGVTGASGGGTQTFALMAVDERVRVAAPVNMISSTMQGGCVCENAPLIRFGNSNMEIGAMMAPRPLLLVSTSGDWTRETPHVEYPAIRSIYELYDATENVENVHLDYGHNYNKESREAMYRFFGKHLIDPEQDWSGFTEPAYEMPSVEQLRLYTEKPDDLSSGDEVIATIKKQMRKRTETVAEDAGDNIGVFNGMVFDAIVGPWEPEPNELAPERISMTERGDTVIERWIIRHAARGDAIPAILYRSKSDTSQPGIVYVSTHGKSDWFDPATGDLVAEVQERIDEGFAVLLIDTFLTGEHHSPAETTERVRIGGYMDTFQPTDTGYRVQDVITAMTFLDARRDISAVLVQGKGAGSLWVRLATVKARRASALGVATDDFSLEDDNPRWAGEFYLPSILSVGGWSAIDQSSYTGIDVEWSRIAENH